MAESQPHEGSSTSDISGGSSESDLQLNVKTLDSQIYSFRVDKNIAISAFKEKIAGQSGVPVGQQRLIFRGKVLKDDHPLSEYNVEDGDTLHLVERQPQPAPGSNNGQATSTNGIRGSEYNAGGSRGRIGHVAHSIVLGTLNVGDSGEAVVPDLSRVIGAVLNSIGIGNQAGGMQPGISTSHGNGSEGSRGNSDGQSQGGDQSGQALHGQSAVNAMNIPLGAGFGIPTLSTPIPDSLNTLIEFMDRMELVLSQNGNQPGQSPTASGDPPITELPSNSRGLPTVQALNTVLRHAQRLLSDHAVAALSHTAGRLDEVGGSNDPTVREQVQMDAARLGMAMQHFGALFLELGRTILTLRMGQSQAESSVNAGPAVYISPSGPNPIMVQPFPLQTSSLFGASSGMSPNQVAMGPIGVGSGPRNVNIHIHTGAALAPIVSTVGSRAPAGGVQGERSNATEFGDSGQVNVSSAINVTTTAVPLRPAVVSVSGAVPPSSAVSQAPASDSISSLVSQINSQLERLAANMQNESHPTPGQSLDSDNPDQHVGCGDRDGNDHHDLSSTVPAETSHSSPQVTMSDDQKAQTVCCQPDNAKEMGDSADTNTDPSTSSVGSSHGVSHVSSQSNDNPDSCLGVPLGLGLGSLQPKRRGKQLRTQSKNDGVTASQQSTATGQQFLQSLASVSAQENADTLSSGSTAIQNANSQTDVVDAMSQILRTPALDGLLAGVSQQTGVGSPDMLRNMLQQFTQNPAMRNTVNQIAQQIDSHDLGSMFSGLDRGQGGGIDLSRMMQQMMPIVSQALGGLPSASQVTPENTSRGMAPTINDDPQIDLHEMVERLENQSPSEEIFRTLVDQAVRCSCDATDQESAVEELCCQEGLAQEFAEMLHHDISRRLKDDMGS